MWKQHVWPQYYSKSNKRKSFKSFVNETYNIDDLLKGDAEGEEEGLGLVDDGSLEGVVVNDQIVQQLLLVVAAHRFWKSIIII